MIVKNKLLILSVLFLSGCSILKSEPVEKIVTKEVFIEKLPLNLDDPEPFVWRNLEFMVITPENYEEKINELKKSGKSTAIVALDMQSYEVLSLNMAEIMKYMEQQKFILLQYREYYETKGDENTSLKEKN